MVNKKLLVLDVVESCTNNGTDMLVRKRIIDVLPVPSELDQIRKAERLELVGDRRFRHAEQFRQIAHAQLTEKQGVEQLRARPVAAQFEQHGHLDVLLFRRHLGADFFHNLLVDGFVVVICSASHGLRVFNG